MAAVAAVPLLLLSAACFWSQPAAVGGDAPATELQKHVAFFDSDHDGIITFGETYRGLRTLGFGIFGATVSATFINGDIGPKTRPEDADGSWFSIYVQNIHKGIHGSDTGAFDSEGRFVSEKFNEIFTRHAKTVPDGLTSDELDEMLHAYADHTEHKDSSGWLQAATEWRATFEAAKDKDDILRKDTVRAVYDGSFFSKLAKENDD
ncbi:probable peroxygenase 4 isoform X1 [Oryza sativa Japonica Group]|uniref:probable peroxygenase 4 isoform X1 n=1 Tax=Oryza sativa subsp. japonica TaxID=39947 RepID=UPI00339C7A3D